LTAHALAHAGHTVYASMRETKSRHAPQVQEVAAYAAEHAVDLRPIDVSSQESCNAAIEEIISTARRLDVVVHNAGHMAFWQATVSGAYRPDAGRRGSRECGVGSCPRRAPSSHRPRRPASAARLPSVTSTRLTPSLSRALEFRWTTRLIAQHAFLFVNVWGLVAGASTPWCVAGGAAGGDGVRAMTRRRR